MQFSGVDVKDMANAIRALAMDAVEAAASGHVGMPLGMADVASILFARHLKHDPLNPDWADRDRFVLSAGHGSMLIYALLHLTRYASVPRSEIRAFRQLGSRTPGHPENFVTPGVETTTGPLGQGLATAIGMAIAERHLNARFGDDLVDHHTWVLAGDGCLMEGISQEAITLAGHMKLNKLIVLFDDNSVTIDGSTDLADSTDQRARFEASGWVTRAIDGHDPDAIDAALAWAKLQDHPVMIACKTVIGFGAPTLAGTGKAHGGPYGPDEIAGIRQEIGWPYPPFEIPEPIERAWHQVAGRGVELRQNWEDRLASSAERAAFEAAMAGELPADLNETVARAKDSVVQAAKDDATRKWSGHALEFFTEAIPEMIGGSADLTGSNNTRTNHTLSLTPDDWAGRYIHYGVREHGMAAAMNGLARHGGVIPYSGTFLIFCDYSRAAIRLGSLMGERVIHVLTHDSIGLGEDGPTHQPVEHLASLRAIPNVMTFRPADGIEAVECWEAALHRTEGPSVMALTRQKVRTVREDASAENLCSKGAYILADADRPDAVILASGSEVGLVMGAKETLEAEGISVRVVSVPCMELFELQDAKYQDSVLQGDTPKVAVEAAVRFGWDRLIGRHGRFIGMEGFGASAPADQLYAHFGITEEAVVSAVKEVTTG